MSGATLGSPTLLAEGFLLGWSVAWPPGPINAEMIRRGLAGERRAAIAIGLGACSGDFLWALAVATGLAALTRVETVQRVLGVVSLLLLTWLAVHFLRTAWRHARSHAVAGSTTAPVRSGGAGRAYAFGFGMALSSPWNIVFWIGALGRGAGSAPLGAGLVRAVAVVAGALTWVVVLNTATRFGARFAKPSWDIITHAATGLLMLYFAIDLAMKL